MPRRSKFQSHPGKPGVPKATRYRRKIDSVETDARGMVEAYGPFFVHELVNLIHSGNHDLVAPFIERWRANRDLGLKMPSLRKAIPVLELAIDPEPFDELFPDLI